MGSTSPHAGTTDHVIHVVVVAYKSAGLLGRCLAPLLADQGVAQVVVVDNASDAATEAVCSSVPPGDRPRVRYVSMSNVGYARAVNAGASLRRGDTTHVVILNPDVALTRSLSDLVERAAGRSWTILTALLDQGGGCLNVRPMADLRRELLSAAMGSRAYRLTRLSTAPGGIQPVPQIDGSLMVLPADEFAALGGLDERFELYFEDVDLCCRANTRDGCWAVNDMWGTHVGGASSAVSGTGPYAALHASRTKFLRKRYGVAAIPVVVLAAVVELVARLAAGTHRREALAAGFAAQLRELVRPGSRRYLDRDDDQSAQMIISPASPGCAGSDR
jgi:GT2 family glycosyltransferase